MKLKLTALKDFEAINIWQESIFVSKGEKYDAELLETNDGLKMIAIVLGGVRTAYEVRFVKEFFDIKEVK